MPNTIYLNESVIRRSAVSKNHGYIFHKLLCEEMEPFTSIIEKHVPNKTIASLRSLQYLEGSAIRRHKDAPSEVYGDSDSGLIILLTPPSEYKGGELIMNKTLMDLNVGDGVVYDYSIEHEVKKIKEGERWILNVRLLTED